MLRGNKKRDRVVHRGPVSGTGEALRDEHALKILDERVNPTEDEAPDLGIVIERHGTEATPADGQQRLGSWEGPGMSFKEDLEVIDELQLLKETPAAITWAPWTEGCMICEQSTYRPIIKAGLGTRLPLLIDTSWHKLESKGSNPSTPRFPVRVRLVFGDSIFDLPIESKDLDQPDLTLRDLLVRATGLNVK